MAKTRGKPRVREPADRMRPLKPAGKMQIRPALFSRSFPTNIRERRKVPCAAMLNFQPSVIALGTERALIPQRSVMYSGRSRGRAR